MIIADSYRNKIRKTTEGNVLSFTVRAEDTTVPSLLRARLCNPPAVMAITSLNPGGTLA